MVFLENGIETYVKYVRNHQENPDYRRCTISFKPKVLEIAAGGTNASTMATSTGIVKYDGTSLVTSSTAKIDSSNRLTNTAQPAFKVSLTTTKTNVTGDGTVYQCVFDTTDFDQNSNITIGGTTFTAPVTGKYHFDLIIRATNLIVGHTGAQCRIVVAGTSSGTYVLGVLNPYVCQDAVNGGVNLQGNICITMTAGDTATTGMYVVGSTKTVTFFGVGSSFWCGYLVC